MSDPVNLQPALERQLGTLLFQNTALQAQNERLQAELTAKTKELAATKLALDALKPTGLTQENTTPDTRTPGPAPDTPTRKGANGGVRIPKPSQAGYAEV